MRKQRASTPLDVRRIGGQSLPPGFESTSSSSRGVGRALSSDGAENGLTQKTMNQNNVDRTEG